MAEAVNELKIFQGGARLPAVTSKLLLADSSGNLVKKARGSISWTTASLGANAGESDDVNMGFWACHVLVVQTSTPARVRAYPKSTYRTADLSRAVGTDPTGDHGLQLEVVTIATELSYVCAPPIMLSNQDFLSPAGPNTTIYWRITNLDSVARAVTVTLTALQEE